MQKAALFPLSSLFLGLFSARIQALVWPAPPVAPPVIAAVSEGPSGGNSTFQQLIDHSNPDLGTFSQRYWWNSTFWEGPGSPVVIFNPGEAPAEYYTGFLTNRTITGLYAQAIGAAIILIEHRYWGDSSPFQVLDTQNLTYLTLENAVADMVHFARNVRLPFDPSGATNSPNAPWINVGGSYSGALAAWIDKLSPGTFWAHHASSAPVQAIRDFWAYFQPIQEGMPKNCSNSMTSIAKHVDQVLGRKDETETLKLKTMFGLEQLEHDDDFASYVALLPPELSQTFSTFFEMCDTIEGTRPVEIEVPDASTTAPNVIFDSAAADVEKALANYASWYKNEYLVGTCNNYGYDDWSDPHSVACYDSYNETSPIFKDYSVGNRWNRQWFWMLCNQPFFYWQTGAPPKTPSIVSRYITPEYMERQCHLLFPPQGNATFGAAAGKTEVMLNEMTDGWFVNTTRLIWLDGEFDPWRSASVSSVFRPGGPQRSIPETPVFLVPGARHCNDLTTASGASNEDMRRVQLRAIAKMVEWVVEFYDLKERGEIGEDGWMA
ncbi:putative serine protease EDA2 [Madurella mycetomatis]|uniref:Serine protease EDA2 n=1 Tax=Madurella mycetomatis TaxID=100816 RepID=A0A175W7I1_9PEZI|nr:putative serine protease EDA2 [Madurella mycetomatis]